MSFDNALADPTCESWFTKRLRFSRASFQEICRFLRVRGVRFAHSVTKKHSYEKCAATLYFFASVAGYSETADAMGMAKIYVIGIVDEVVRVLYDAADDVIYSRMSS
ncbi:putative nuclease harbi1 [Phytophthora pseudosyringae]|uniref:Putative nuclease harbi1 n=1 Tax=Phytophthora pseudosyringae TaxID=221518 RepID=A0A8T1V4Z5_9STRA|nr:putative nuclease harbi1 [Phytophthora pseudosyringae]